MGTALRLALLTAAVCFPAPQAHAEVAQKHGVRVFVNGRILPEALPRKGRAPISVSITGRIGAVQAETLPQLRTIQIGMNREGRLSAQGIPRCRLGRIDPSTTAEALAACRTSLVGEGRFSADVRLPEQSPFPSEGKMLAFNGRLRGKPAIFAHIYGTDPVPTSYVLPFLISSGKGRFGTVLEASLPHATGEWGFVTGISMTLNRRYTFRGKHRSFLSAGCPAPSGFNRVPFPLLKTTFGFAGGTQIPIVLTKTCRTSG